MKIDPTSRRIWSRNFYGLRLEPSVLRQKIGPKFAPKLRTSSQASKQRLAWTIADEN